MFQKYIYPHLPVPLQNGAISAFGYVWNRRRFGGIFKYEYDRYRLREKYSRLQLEDYQTQQLRKILLHSFTTVPYYNRLFKNAGFDEQAFKEFTINQLRLLPVLNKNTLRQEGKNTLISSVREKNGEFYASSGSTGTPVNILYSHNFHQRLSALYEARVRNWAGVSRFDARAMIGGRRVVPEADAKPPYHRYNVVEKQVYFSAYHISAQNASDYLEAFYKYDVRYLVGYAMSCYFLARFLKQNNLKAPKLKAVLTSSEKLSDEMRNVLSEVFQCSVFDAWSGVEWCGLISQNEYGQLLLSPDSAYVEILKADGSYAQPGEEGEMVCTGFLNYDQPLIRYKIGDVVRLAADQTTKCGRAFPVIEEIIGRTEDVVTGADGRQMVRFHGIFINLPNVVKGQVVQEALDSFTVNVETQGLSVDEKALIRKRMESQLGSIKLHINELKTILPGANGKYKAVISNVNKAATAISPKG